MFRRRRGGGRGGADPYTLMLLLQLGQQVVRLLDNNGNGNGRQSPPPIATLSLGFSMLAAYFSADLADAGLMPNWLASLLAPTLDSVCLQPRLMVEGTGGGSSSWWGGGWRHRPHHQWSRLVASAFTHTDLSHLAYNLSSLLWKGALLERRMGSAKFALLFAELLLLSHGLFVGVAWLLGCALPAWCAAAFGGRVPSPLRALVRDVGWPMYAHTCAVGCSAVLFALKVVVQRDQQGAVAWGGLVVPARHAAWLELIVASLVNPRASFAGHLAGIAAGLLHVKVLEPGWERGWRWWSGGQRQWQRERQRRPAAPRFGGGGAAEAAERDAVAAAADARRRAEAMRGRQQQQQEQEPAASAPLSAEAMRAARLRRLAGGGGGSGS